jgi:hypothetical protein
MSSEHGAPVGAGIGSITPEPTDEEAAAIIAALEVGLPRAAVAEPARPAVSRWRFSGRWWTRPVPSRRSRPGA